MRFLMGVVFTVDATLLRAMLVARTWLLEWLSVTRAVFERFLIAAYLTGSFVQAWGRWHYIPWMILPLFCAGGMWIRHRRSDRERAQRMLAAAEIANRIAFVLLFMLIILPLQLLTPWDRISAGLLIQGLGFCAFEYSVSLPDSGERGRRRKLSLEKVRELFGTSWEPLPEGAR